MKSYNNKKLILTSDFELLGSALKVNQMKETLEINMGKITDLD